ncbi:MAG TPA: DUF2255 family protein [Thermoanaerobaculia bacterium]
MKTIDAKYVWIRAGDDHRFTAVWFVRVNGCVYVRSWYVKPAGWHAAFLREKRGAMKFAKDGSEIPVRAVVTRSERIQDAVERAYAEKYTTPSSMKYVKGFRTPGRRATTMALVPVR